MKTHDAAMKFANFSGAPAYPRDFYMPFHFHQALRASTAVLALSTALAACGGGNSPGDESASEPVSANSTTVGTDTTNAQAAPVTPPTNGGADTTSSNTTDAGTSADATAMAANATGPQSGEADAVPAIINAGTTATVVASSSGATPAAGLGGKTTIQVATARSGVGINLTAFSTFSPEMATIDQMKRAGGWITQCSGCSGFTGGASAYDTLEESKLDLDANGWVRSLPAASNASVKYRTVTTILAQNGFQQAGEYTVLYDGQGTLSYSGAGAKVASKSSPGRDIVSVTNHSTVGLFLNIVATTPTNYIRNIRVLPPGGACANDMATYVAAASSCTGATGAFVPFEKFPAGSIWHPKFLADLKGFRTLRFMDWASTNANTTSSWSARTSLTARTWNISTGVPVEAIFDLAGKLSAEAWVNIPPHADDDYVHQYAQVAHQKLAAGANLDVELGNEMWNYSFPATQWALAQAKAKWPAEVAAGADQNVLELNWYGMRLAQVCQIIKQEFGSDASHVKCVANTQAASSWATNQVLQCSYGAKVLGQPCAKFYDAVAIAPYFGYYIGNPAYRSTLSKWYSAADNGLSELFTEITGLSTTGQSVAAPLAVAGTSVPKGALAQAKGWMTATKAVLDTYKLPMWAYEGGQHLLAPSNDTDTTMLNLMLAANRDPRMGAAYQTMMQDWKAAGGQTFMFFADVGVYNKYGMWGLKENQFSDNAPKWKAAVQWRDNVACWWSGC